VFDKALESTFGYITVLPGAFSAYKWEALKGAPLLDDYFLTFIEPQKTDCAKANMYLAEDRVLCLSLVSKVGEAYLLKYIKASAATTDVPNSFQVLLSQRRRWINGSWHALIDAMKVFGKIKKSKHTCCRKTAFFVQLGYFFANVMFTWLMVGALFVVLAVIIRI
jgi:chitin synthase